MLRTLMFVSVFYLAILAPAWPASAEDWPQWRGPHRDGTWSETGLFEKFPEPQLAPKWRVEIHPGYSSPTVAEGRVYLMDRVTEPAEQERILCLDSKTGQEIWQFSYPCEYKQISYTAGPRGAITVHDGRAFAVGAMGHFHCLDAAKGAVLWQHDMGQEYAIRFDELVWGVSASPLVEGNLVITQADGTNGACLVAFDTATGVEKWRALEDRASYSSPIIIDQAGQRVLVCWTGDSVAGVAPATGKVLWREPFAPRKMVLAVASPVVEKDLLFVTGFYDGSMLLRLSSDQPAAQSLWHRRGRSEQNTDALHSIISTPVLDGGHVYGVDSYGELRCLETVKGDRVWESDKAVPHARWSTIHFVKNGDNYWLFNERGELIIARLSPRGYTEISRTKIIEPTTEQLAQRGGVCWSHPAYAEQCVFVRNDKELICVSLKAGN